MTILSEYLITIQSNTILWKLINQSHLHEAIRLIIKSISKATEKNEKRLLLSLKVLPC